MVMTMTTGWGYHQQGEQDWLQIDELGSQLSMEIGCAVHYPAFGKRLFECKCGVIFPAYLAASRNWELIRHKHIEERRYSLA